MQGLGCRVQGLGCRVQGAGIGVQGAGIGMQGAGCRVQGAGCRVRVQGVGANRGAEDGNARGGPLLRCHLSTLTDHLAATRDLEKRSI